MRTSQEAGESQTGKNLDGFTTGVANSSSSLASQSVDALKQLVDEGLIDPTILAYYKSLPSTILGDAGQKLTGRLHFDTPINAVFKSPEEASKSIAKLANEGFPSPLDVWTYQVLDHKGDIEYYLVSACPGQLHTISNKVSDAHTKIIATWAKSHGKTVKFVAFNPLSPVVDGITTKNAARLNTLSPAQQEFQKGIDDFYLHQQDSLFKNGKTHLPTNVFLNKNPIKGNINSQGEINLPSIHGFFDTIENAEQEIARLMSKEGLTGELNIRIYQVTDKQSKKIKGYLCNLWPGTERSGTGRTQEKNTIQIWANINKFEVQLLPDTHSHPDGNWLPSGMGIPYDKTYIHPKDPEFDFKNDLVGDLSIFVQETKDKLSSQKLLNSYGIWVKDPDGSAQLRIGYKPMEPLEQVKLVTDILDAYDRKDSVAIENKLKKLFEFSMQKYDVSGKPIGQPLFVDIYRSLREYLMESPPLPTEILNVTSHSHADTPTTVRMDDAQTLGDRTPVTTDTPNKNKQLWTVGAITGAALLGYLANKVMVEHHKKQTEQTKPEQGR